MTALIKSSKRKVANCWLLSLSLQGMSTHGYVAGTLPSNLYKVVGCPFSIINTFENRKDDQL